MIRNYKKRDIAYIWICALAFLLLVFILSNTMYLYGSQLDWTAEHVPIPDYFRTLFYDTKDLIPDFAFNIGNGQNIYNLSYYGLLSPIILISYLLPFVSMYDYIIVSTCLCVIIAMVLLYIFLRNKGCSSEVSFISSLLFILSTSITLHSHRHIMFINYMPFLIMGLYGVDRKLNKNKNILLILSVFLMIMTSYYYSICGILTLVLYGIYEYIRINKEFKVKEFIKEGIKFSIPVLIGILCSSILIVPTFASLLYNRADSNISITLKDLIMPSINTRFVLYDTYGIGLCAILIPALINIVCKKKENRFLGIVLWLFILFPIFNYILNGTMYIDSKSMIPLLPLYIYVIALFIKDLFDNNVNLKVLIPSVLIVSLFVYLKGYKFEFYIIDIAVVLVSIVLYKVFKNKVIFISLVACCCIVSCFSMNKTDTLALRYTTLENDSNVQGLISDITNNDDEFYRISNNYDISVSVNNIYGNIDYYNSTMYSSIENQDYNKFYYDVINNNIPCRNRVLIVNSSNIMSLMFNNNKYIVSRNKALQGYSMVNSNNGMYVYRNDYVMPIGFATSNVINYKDYEKYNYAEREEALLNMIVGDMDTNNNFSSNVIKGNLDFDYIFNDRNIKKLENGSYDIDSVDQLKLSYELPEEYHNKILFIRFKMNYQQSCSKGDLAININNVKNKLTCSSWKYHNGNTVFDYVLAEKDLSKLTISFSKGHYNVSDFEVYVLDYNDISDVRVNVDEFKVDKANVSGDVIEGDISVSKDGYFMISIPYDKGFNILVDDKKIDYEKVDYSFIGFKINEGNHHIKIEYNAPYKNVGLVLSIIGILSFIGIGIYEKKTIK